MENNVLTQSRSEASVSSFVSRVFMWVAAGLGVSAMGSWWLLAQPDLVMGLARNTWIMFALIIVEFVLVIWLSAKIMTLGTAMATSMFFAFSFLNGITLAPTLLFYTGASIVTTFVVTSGTFFFFAVYGLTTKRDLTRVGQLAMMALIGLILVSLVNMFMRSAALDWVLTFVGIAVFMGLIAWRTQRLKELHAMAQGAENEKRLVIIGALGLYLDFINLFLMLLRIFGKRRD